MAPKTRSQAKKNDKRKAPMVEENEVEAMETEPSSVPQRSLSPNVQTQPGFDMQQLTLLMKQTAKEAVQEAFKAQGHAPVASGLADGGLQQETMMRQQGPSPPLSNPGLTYLTNFTR